MKIKNKNLRNKIHLHVNFFLSKLSLAMDQGGFYLSQPHPTPKTTPSPTLLGIIPPNIYRFSCQNWGEFGRVSIGSDHVAKSDQNLK